MKVTGKLGAGGMGEVYRAVDRRLDRTVAIKVLSSQAAMSTDMRARFEREAKTISSLNHPHICTLHDVGHQDGIDYLVMECMDGEELSRRLQRGRIEVAEALTIAVQVASGLEAAHRKGVIHRDLKPNNIFLTSNGAKLLDFGLAKLHAEPVTGMGDETNTTPVTGAGAIVGTLQYMSPEQLEGKEADARSDIFSLGATLYEMVTGKRAFSGESKVSLIGSIMKEEPRQIGEIVPSVPPALERLIRKCLHKDPEKRWQSAGDLRDELEWIASAGSQAGIPAPVASKRRMQLRVSWLVAIAAAVVAVILGLDRLRYKAPEQQTMRFTITAPEGLARVEWPVISPDGKWLAFVGYDSTDGHRIWLRPLNSELAHAVPGTESAFRPFWSPDSKYLAFFDRSHELLKKVAVSGGQPQTICKALGGDGSWGKDDIILFDDFGTRNVGLVQAVGGEPRVLISPDTSSGETYIAWPCFLPDGRHFIYVSRVDSLITEQKYVLRAGCVDESGTTMLGKIESRPVYCEPGFVLYAKDGMLVAHRFDAEKLEFMGSPITVSDSIGFASNSLRGINASASDNGIIVWEKETADSWSRGYLEWVDRAGNVIDTIGSPEIYGDIALSPDGSKLVFSIPDDNRDFKLHVMDLDSKTSYRLTSDATRNATEELPKWSPDGRAIVFTLSVSQSSRIMYCALSDPVTKPVHSLETGVVFPVRWSAPDSLWFGELHMLTGPARDLVTKVNVSDLIDTNHNMEICSLQGALIVSDLLADGRFALCEDVVDSGIYVHDLTKSGRRWRLSAKGIMPRYCARTNEVYFFKGNDFMVVKVDLAGELTYGACEKLFSKAYRKDRDNSVWAYDVSPDGERFLFISADSAEHVGTSDIEVVINWEAGLQGK